jgi:hypothetical protein
MTLNEKFDKATDGWIVADACEEIADDYAIEFNKWVLDRRTFKDYIHKDSKELLEIFKKEKGL